MIDDFYVIVHVSLGVLKYCNIYMWNTSGKKFLKLISVAVTRYSSSNHCCECIIYTYKYFITMFHVTRFFYLFIVDHKVHHFIDSFHYCCEHQGKCSRLIWLVTIFHMWLIPYFWCNHIHTSRHTCSIIISNFIKFLLKLLILQLRSAFLKQLLS